MASLRTEFNLLLYLFTHFHCGAFLLFRFNASYGRSNFPVSLKLRQQMFVQAKVDSNDKHLSIMAEQCFATPTPDEDDLKRHDILVDG